MSGKVLSIQKEGHIEIVTLNLTKPDRAELIQLLSEFAELFIRITWDEEIRVVILTGFNEKSFSLEIDLIGLAPGGSEGEPTKFCALAEQISKLDRPVIAAIRGDTVGLGMEVALACDIRIASEVSCFGLPEIKTGLIPWDGGTQRLPRLVGKSKALEMILTGERINAQEALRIGLVNKVVPTGELMVVAMRMAQEMASKGPIALRYAKEAIYKGMDMTLEQGLRLEADLYCLLHTTKDRTKGIEAFKEKKSPNFKGT